MQTILKSAREKKGLLVREVAQQLGIDQALVSKFETGSRLPTRNQILDLANLLEIPTKQLITHWLKEKINRELGSDIQLLPEVIALFSEETISVLREPAAPYRAFDDILSALEQHRSKLQEFRKFDSYRITQALELEYTFESNRIEGNTLTLQETDLVVNEGLTISGKSMREHLEAINHQEAIVYMKDLASKNTPIRERDVLALHNLILRGIDPENAGRYRQVQVMITGSKHMPPPPYLVPVQMEAFFTWLSKAESQLHPVVLAAEAHQRLVTIHPFIDGNGRTSRLLMNLILLRFGFVIANIKGDLSTRKKYYHALEQAQTESQKQEFITFILEQENQALVRYLEILGAK